MDLWNSFMEITDPDIYLFCMFMAGTAWGIFVTRVFDLVCAALDWLRSRIDKEAP